MSASPAEKEAAPGRPFVMRVLIVAGVAALALAFYALSSILLLVAAAVVVAVVVHLIADPLQRRTGFSRKLSVASSVAIILIVLGAGGYFFGVKIADQVDNLANALPAAWQSLYTNLSESPIGRLFLRNMEGDNAEAGQIAGLLRDTLGGMTSIILNIVAAFAAGVILAVFPERYRDGALRLLPKSSRPPVRDAANLCGRTLKGWLVGQLIAMAVIGALTSAGLMLVGLPSWLVLGLFAGAAQFVPLIGPIVSAIPGLIIAASMDFQTVLWTLLVYVGVQQLESNFLTPFVMRKTAALPMALTIIAVIAFGSLFGVAGSLLATPITVVAYVFVRELYIRRALGDDDVGPTGAAANH